MLDFRDRFTVDFRRNFCSTISESLLILTTLSEMPRRAELARASGDGEGERDRLCSEFLLPSPENRNIPLLELGLRCNPTPVLSAGKSSPNRDCLGLGGGTDSPPAKETLPLFDCLSCLCPEWLLEVDLMADFRPASCVRGVKSSSSNGDCTVRLSLAVP